MKPLLVITILTILLLSACQAPTPTATSAIPNTGKAPTQALSIATQGQVSTAPTASLLPAVPSAPPNNTPTQSPAAMNTATVPATNAPAEASPTTTPAINTPSPIPPEATLASGETIVDQAQQIQGVWKGNYGIDGGPGYINFRLDGSFTVAPSPDGAHGLSGNYLFQGQEIQIHDDFCGSDVGHYQVRLQNSSGSQPSLRFVLIDDPCGERVYRLLNRGETWQKQP